MQRRLQFSFCTGQIQFLNWSLAGRAWDIDVHADGMIRRVTRKEEAMPLVDIELIEGVFDHAQKQEMIRKVTDAMLEVEGEAMRSVTWVRIRELASGEWAIGGKALTAADVKALQKK